MGHPCPARSRPYAVTSDPLPAAVDQYQVRRPRVTEANPQGSSTTPKTRPETSTVGQRKIRELRSVFMLVVRMST